MCFGFPAGNCGGAVVITWPRRYSGAGEVTFWCTNFSFPHRSKGCAGLVWFGCIILRPDLFPCPIALKSWRRLTSRLSDRSDLIVLYLSSMATSIPHG